MKKSEVFNEIKAIRELQRRANKLNNQITNRLNQLEEFTQNQPENGEVEVSQSEKTKIEFVKHMNRLNKPILIKL